MARVVEPEAERGLPSLARAPPTSGSSALTTSVVESGSALDGDAPAFGDELELAVAVELVAKEVPERDGTRPRAPDRLGQRALVDLEEAELRACGRRRGRRRPRRARFAPAWFQARRCAAEDLRGHRGGRRLAVRRRDERDTRAAGGRRARRRPRDRPSRAACPGSVVPPPRPAARDTRADGPRRRSSRARAVPSSATSVAERS